MRTFASYFRVLLFLTIAYVICEILIEDSEAYPIALLNPYVLAGLGLFMLILIALETVLGAIQGLADQMISAEQKAKLEEAKKERAANTWFKRLLKHMWKSKPLEDKSVLIEDHDYDGIRELDNPLPPWWLYLFYGTLIFGVVYLVRFHVLDGPTQYEEFDSEMVLAQTEIEQYQASLPQEKDLVISEDEAMLAAGKKIFTMYCQVCHRPDGGGSIGPNLTDAYWIMGGTLNDVFDVISNGGRSGKGMVAWKNSLNKTQIEEVSNYVMSLQGTKPPNPKAPEGEEFVIEAIPSATIDSLAIDSI
jgi:cytochrome c oxidase cbb3-type subunit 3